MSEERASVMVSSEGMDPDEWRRFSRAVALALFPEAAAKHFAEKDSEHQSLPLRGEP